VTAAEDRQEAGQSSAMKVMPLRLPDGFKDQLKDEAAEAGMSLSDWCRYKLGMEVALPQPLDGPTLLIPAELAERLEPVWRAGGYESLEGFVAEALEGAVHRELAALRDRVASIADREVAVLGQPARRFSIQQVACRHPVEAREYRAGVGFCTHCGGVIGRA